MAREITNMILEMVSEGALDKDQLIRDLLMWMSESDVEDFADNSGLLDNEDEDEAEPDDSMDGDHDSAMASAGWGTDEDYGHYGPED